MNPLNTPTEEEMESLLRSYFKSEMPSNWGTNPRRQSGIGANAPLTNLTSSTNSFTQLVQLNSPLTTGVSSSVVGLSSGVSENIVYAPHNPSQLVLTGGKSGQNSNTGKVALAVSFTLILGTCWLIKPDTSERVEQTDTIVQIEMDKATANTKGLAPWLNRSNKSLNKTNKQLP